MTPTPQCAAHACMRRAAQLSRAHVRSRSRATARRVIPSPTARYLRYCAPTPRAPSVRPAVNGSAEPTDAHALLLAPRRRPRRTGSPTPPSPARPADRPGARAPASIRRSYGSTAARRAHALARSPAPRAPKRVLPRRPTRPRPMSPCPRPSLRDNDEITARSRLHAAKITRRDQREIAPKSLRDHCEIAFSSCARCSAFKSLNLGCCGSACSTCGRPAWTCLRSPATMVVDSSEMQSVPSICNNQ